MIATFSDIVAMRLQLSDPGGVVSIDQVPDLASLPTEPAIQTAYFVVATGQYMIPRIFTSATPGDYKAAELFNSDQSLSLWFDQFGKSGAIDSAIRQIIAQLGPKMQLARMANGTDSYDYTSLRDMLDYYKNLLTIFKDQDKIQGKNSTGRIGKAKSVMIAGGLE